MFSRYPVPPSDPVNAAGTLGHHNRALLATATLLLVAYSNLSFTGLLFLLGYLYWAAACISTPYAANSYKHHKKLWTATTAAALLVFTLQLLVQLLYGSHLLPSSSNGAHQQQDSVIVVVLDALGFGSISGLHVGQIILVLVAPLLCVLAAAAEASEASQVLTALQAVPPQLCVTQQQQQQQQHSEDQPAVLQPTAAAAPEGSPNHAAAAAATAVAAFCPAASIPLTLGLTYTNSGVITAVTLLLSAVLWPSCLSLVYMVIICWGLVCWAWGSPKTWVPAGWATALQTYTGVHLLLLYVAQLPLLQIKQLDLLYDILGLYNIGDTAHVAGSGVHGGSGALATQIVHMISLHVLYMSLGFYVGFLRQPLYKRVAAAVRQQYKQQQQQQRPRRQHSGAVEELLQPLLTGESAADRLQAGPHHETGTPQRRQQQQQQAHKQPSLQLAATPSSSTTTTPSPAAAPTAAGHLGSTTTPPTAAVIGSSRTATARWDQTLVLLQVLLPFLFGCGEFLLLQLLSAPAVAGIAIAGFSLVQVSVVGCATLLLALWSLLAPSRLSKHLLPVASPWLLLFYLAWLIDAYIATALDGIATPPTVLTSLGVWGYSQQYPALLPLLLHLMTAAAVAGLSCSRAAAAGSTGGIFLPAAVTAAAGLTDWGLASGTADANVLPAAVAAGPVGTQETEAVGIDGVDHSRRISQSSDTGMAAASSSVTAAGRELRQLFSLGSRMSAVAAVAAAATGGGGSNISVPSSPNVPVGLGGSAPATPLNRGTVSRQWSLVKPQRAASLNLGGSSPRGWRGFGTVPLGQEEPPSPSGQHALNPSSQEAAAAAAAPTLAAAAVYSTAPESMATTWSEFLGLLWAGFGTGLIQVAWHLGRAIVPLSCVILAASQPDVLHGVYLLAMLLGFCGSISTWSLAPTAPAVPAWFQHAIGACGGSSSSSQQPHGLPAAHLPHHRLLRFYGSCHLLVVYLAVVMQLPGLQSDWNEYVLKLVGLWDPKILSDLIPVMLLLVTATVHVTLGKWLMTRPPAGGWGFKPQGTVGPAAAVAAAGTVSVPAAAAAAVSVGSDVGSSSSATALGPLHEDLEHGVQCDQYNTSAGDMSSHMLLWFECIHPRLLYEAISWCCRLAASAGAAVAVLMGYLLLLWDTPVGLVGCAYLLLLVLLLLLPPKASAVAAPRPAQRRQQLNRRRQHEDWELSENMQPLLDDLDLQSQDRSRSITASGGSSTSSGSWRWLLPLLLSVLCVADLVAQYVLVVGALVQDRQLLPPDVSVWIRDVVGIDDAAAGGQLLAALLRPTVLLIILALYRYCVSIGALLLQQGSKAATLAALASSSAAAAAAAAAVDSSRALAAQSSWLWLIKRWFILHSDLLVSVACFAAAMQAPSALGLLLLCGTLILAVQQNMLAAAARGRTIARQRQQQTANNGRIRSIRGADLFVEACMIALQVLAGVWLLALYALQVEWIRLLLVDHAPPLLPWLLLWLGLPVSGGDPDQAQVQGLQLEQILRYKVVILAVAAVRSKAQQWQQQLPEAVVAAAAPGNPCPLFWPLRSAAAGAEPAEAVDRDHDRNLPGYSGNNAPGHHPAAAAAAAAGLDPQAVGTGAGSSWNELEPVWRTAEQIVSPLYTLGLKVLHQLGMQTSKVLAAMDIPEGAAQVATYTSTSTPPQASSSRRRQLSQPQQPHSKARIWAIRLRWWFIVISAGFRDFFEGFWSMWGGEWVMLLLLAAAMLSSNAWSLVYMVLVGLGMAASASSADICTGSSRPRWSVGLVSNKGWWSKVVAVLVLSLVIQYAALLGPYPLQPPSTPSPAPPPQNHPQPAATQAQQAIRATNMSLPTAVVASPGIGSHNHSSNSTLDLRSSDMLQFYLSVLHPAGFDASNSYGHSFNRSSSHRVSLQADPDDQAAPRLLVWYWLGLVAVQPLVLWLLGAAAAIALNVMAQGPADTSSSSGAALATHAALDQLVGVCSSDLSRNLGAMRPGQFASSQEGIGTRGITHQQQQQQQQPALFMPVSYSRMSHWSILDWSRYHLLKHSLDLVLVCVAALCTLQKDLLHAVYLAITLVLFRQRHRLMMATAADSSSSSNRQLDRRPFQWLPTFNFCVMAATLMYQAPLELILGSTWSYTCQLGPGTPPRCTLPHLLGFCKLLTWQHSPNPTPAEAATLGPVAYSYSYAYGPFPGYSSSTLFITSGAFADLLLWVLLRLQYKLFRSDLYQKLMRCVAEEQRATAAKQQQQRQQWYDQQARDALEMSRLRLARTLRISKLKASMLADDHSGSLVYRSSSTADTTVALIPNGSEQEFNMPWRPPPSQQQRQQQQQQQQRVQDEELRCDAAAGLPRPRSHSRLSDLAAHQQLLFRQQQQHMGLAPMPQGFGGTRYRHMRTASDPHVGLRWSVLVMEQQQHRSSSALGIAPASSTGALSDHASNAPITRAGSSTAAAPREYIVPDPRLSSLLGNAGLPGSPSSTHSRFEGFNSSARDRAFIARPGVVVSNQGVVPIRPGSWPSSLSAAAADQSAGPFSRPSRSRSDLDLAAPTAAAGHSSSRPGLCSKLNRWFAATFSSSSGWEAGLCYALFISGFAFDFSVFSLVYVVSMLLVPLLAAGRAKAYWTVMLVYTEVLLFMQYSFLTAARCLCVSATDNNSTADPSADPSPSGPSTSGGSTCTWILQGLDPYTTRHYFDVLGLHNTSAGVLPLFLIYLATLMYNYRLRRTQALELLDATRPAVTLPRAVPAASYGRGTGSATVTLLLALQGWYRQLLLWVQLQLHHLAYHIRCVALYHERGPSWLQLDLALPAPGQPAWTTPEGAAVLAKGFQQALDGLRRSDIAYATCVLSGSTAIAAGGAVVGEEAAAQQAFLGLQQQQQPSEDSWSEVSNPGSRISRHSSVEDCPEIQDAAEQSDMQHDRSSSAQQVAHHTSTMMPPPAATPSHLAVLATAAAAAAASSGFWDLLGLGSSSPLLNPAMAAVSRHPGEHGGLSSYTRLVLRLDRVILAQQHGEPEVQSPHDSGSAVALFEVVCEPFQLQADWTLPWWPRRSSRPGHDAAAALLRLLPTTHSTTAITVQTAASNALLHNTAAYRPSGSAVHPLQEVQGLAALETGVQPPVLEGENRQQQQQQQVEQRQQAVPAAHVVFDALMGMPESDVQLASRLASSVALAAPVAAADVLGAAPVAVHNVAGDHSALGPVTVTPTAAGAAAGTSPMLQDPGVASTREAVLGQPSNQQQQRQHVPEAPEADLQSQEPAAAPTAAQLPNDIQLPATVLGVEHHARSQKDYYALNAILDFLAFIYTAVFYQVVMSNTRTLADLTDERQIPWDYLNALLLLFIITVTDRLVYSLGSHFGKFLLLLGQLLLFIPVCMSLYWSPEASSSGSHARLHLRVFMVLKCVSWLVTALQLKSGFPPRASFDGGGRQRFVFYKKADNLHMMGFYIFQAVPFLYELRALLDWTCSATPLNWYQWLKLEDIRASLFIEQCRGTWREQRVIGERVPRYIKFLQGTLLFCLLLLAIWAPLLLFSSGAPTYTTPGVVEARVNASLGVVTQYGHYQGVMSFPVFEAGSRRTVQNWASGGTSGGVGKAPSISRSGQRWPSAVGQKGSGSGSSGNSSRVSDASLPPELSGYSPDQVKLVCLSQDSDQLWQLSPPARSALEVVLQEPSAALQLSWSITRTAPLASGKGGPGCEGQVNVVLAGETRMQLLEVVRGERESAQLMAINASDPEGWAPGHTGPFGLYWLFWRLRGESCAVKTYMGGDTSSFDNNALTKNGRRNSYIQHSPLHGVATGHRVGVAVAAKEQRVWYGVYHQQQQQQHLQQGQLTAPHWHHSHATSRRTARTAPAPATARSAVAAAAKLRSQRGWVWSSKRQRHQHLSESSYEDWANIQVGCNVSIAGSEAAGGRWWRLHCGVVPTASPSPPGHNWVQHSNEQATAGQTSAPESSRRGHSPEPQKPDPPEPQPPDPPDPQPPEPPEPQPPDPPEPQPPDPDPDDPDPSGGDHLPGYATCGPAVQGPMLVVVLERVQSGLLGAALSAFGITGLYFSVVFGIGRFLRLTVSNIRLRIPYEDFPSTRRLLALVQDIYIARAEGELQLEEELFYLLLKIYKTPQLLNELTRLPPQQQQ